MSTDLFTAALEGEQDILENYKTDNPNPDWDSILDENGNTLIAAAASKGKLHIIEYLVADGASLNIPNAQGRVDLQIAYEDGHPNTARGLIRLYEAANMALPIGQDAVDALAA